MAETWQTVSLFANTHYNNHYFIQFMEFDTKYHFIREETAIYQNSHSTSHSRETFTIWNIANEILQEVCLQRFWQDCMSSFPNTVNPQISPRGAYLKFRTNWGHSFEGALNWWSACLIFFQIVAWREHFLNTSARKQQHRLFLEIKSWS